MANVKYRNLACSLAAALLVPAVAMAQAAADPSASSPRDSSSQVGGPSSTQQPSSAQQPGIGGTGQSAIGGASGRMTSVNGTVVDLHEFMTSGSDATVLGNVAERAKSALDSDKDKQKKVFALDSPQGIIILGQKESSANGAASSSRDPSSQPGARAQAQSSLPGSSSSPSATSRPGSSPDETTTLGNVADRAASATGQGDAQKLSSHLGHQVNITGNLYEKQGIKYLVVNNVSMQSSAPGALDRNGLSPQQRPGSSSDPSRPNSSPNP